MIHAVLNRKRAPIVVEEAKTVTLMPLITMFTATEALPETPVVGVGVVVGTAVIDEVGEVVTVALAV
jgi:hypothetical protein